MFSFNIGRVQGRMCKFIFIHFQSSLPFGALKCILSKTTNRIWKKELSKDITIFRIGMASKLKNAVLKNMRKVT